MAGARQVGLHSLAELGSFAEPCRAVAELRRASKLVRSEAYVAMRAKKTASYSLVDCSGSGYLMYFDQCNGCWMAADWNQSVSMVDDWDRYYQMLHCCIYRVSALELASRYSLLSLGHYQDYQYPA